MAHTLREKLAALNPDRRLLIEAEADRLQAEYLTLQELRKAREMTQVQLANTLGVQQATVAKYERQSDLLISTLASYVEAMGGQLKLTVAFPNKEPVILDALGEGDAPRRKRPTRRTRRQSALPPKQDALA